MGHPACMAMGFKTYCHEDKFWNLWPMPTWIAPGRAALRLRTSAALVGAVLFSKKSSVAWFRQRWFRINLFGSGPGNFLKRQISNHDKCEGTSDSSASKLLRLWRFFSPYVSLCLRNPWPGWPSSLVCMGVFGLLWSSSCPWSSPVSGVPDQIQSQPSRILS